MANIPSLKDGLAERTMPWLPGRFAYPDDAVKAEDMTTVRGCGVSQVVEAERAEHLTFQLSRRGGGSQDSSAQSLHRAPSPGEQSLSKKT